MSKIYLKKVKGGDCDDCVKIKGKHVCTKEFNKTENVSRWKCVKDDIHYIQVFPEVTK